MYEDYPINELTCGSDNMENYYPPRPVAADYNYGGILEGKSIPDYQTTVGRQKKRGAMKNNKKTPGIH